MKKVISLLLIMILLTITGCQGQENKKTISNIKYNNPMEAIKTNFDKLSQKDISKVYAESDDMASQVNREFVKRINTFSWELFQLLQREGEGNVFISPYSISSALTMLYNGVDNNTKDQMEKVLNYENMSLEEINKGFQSLMISLMRADADVKIDIANSVWIREGFNPKEDFVKLLEEYYFSHVFTKDFNDSQTVEAINEWISDATNEMIDQMIEKIDSNTVMYLINAIYFKGDWSFPFKEDNTQMERFHMGDKTIDVDMMHQFEALKFFYNDDLIGVQLPYGRKRMAMYAFVPRNEDDIDTLLEGLHYDEIDQYFYQFNEFPSVEVKMPKFKVEYGIKELKDTLKAMGIVDAFEDGVADLTKIEERLFVGSVAHKAVIEVNEKGSKAAAATVIDVKEESEPYIDPNIDPVFIADQPFFFVIRDNYTGSILFMGKIGDLQD